MRIDRRTVVSGIGASFLTGCCTMPDRISASAGQQTVLPVIAPPKLDGSSTTKLAIFDAHAHFFNATDLQAGGYVAGPIANEFGIDPKFKKLLKAAGKFIDFVAKLLAPSAAKEYDYLQSLPAKNKSANDVDVSIREFNAQHSLKIYEAMVKHKFADEYNSYAAYVATQTGRSPEQLTQKLVETALNGELKQDAWRDKSTVLEELAVANPEGVLELVCQLLTYRFHSVRKHQVAYGDQSYCTRCVGAAGAMVDFQYFLDDCPSYSHIEDQIRVYEQISQLTGGYLLCIAPFNPALDRPAFERQMQTLESGLCRGVIRGVKIYPTIGYRPYGNVELGLPYKPPVPAAQLDAALGELYTLCTKYEAPVMGHAGHSMAPTDPLKELTSPESWGKALQAFPDLKVNLGHFGGGYAPAGGSNWGIEFAKLMRESSGVHADIGFWDELADGDADRIELLKCVLRDDHCGGGSIADRLMFGTDWMMLLQYSGWRAYPDRVLSVMTNILESESYALEQFFLGNARGLFDTKEC